MVVIMTTKTIIKENKRNMRYYINISNNENFQQCFIRLNISADNIISCDINEKSQLVIVSDKLVNSGYTKIEYIPTYDNIGYITPITFADNNYKILTISIIKALYKSSKNTNYESCAQIINSHFTDTIIDDLYQIVLMTLYKNLQWYENTSINTLIYWDCLHEKHKNTCYVWDSKTNNFIIPKNICDTVYLACYRGVASFLYNGKTKHDKKNVVGLYDTDNKENNYIVDSLAFKQNIINDISNNIKNSDNIVKNVNEKLQYLVDVLQATQTKKVYCKCCKVLKLMIKGNNQSTIANILEWDNKTVRKYQNIIIDTYNIINDNFYKNDSYLNVRAYLNRLDNDYNSYVNDAKIFINFKECKGTIEQQQIDNIIYKCNNYYHAKKQAMYNELFHALPYDNKSMVVRCKMVESFYRHELQIDRQF